MFIAWLMTISLFLICYFATVTIMNGLIEKDNYDLAILHSQQENISIMDEVVRKQAV
jgi:hypothetical protein